MNGVFKQRVFGVSNPFKGPIPESPTTPVPPGMGAPGNASGGFSFVLVGRPRALESFASMAVR
jgi:hypothetical protein